MQTGETVIDSSFDWLAKAAVGAAIGAVLMRLWDALKMVSREDLSKALDEFSKNQVAPLKERQSKFDGTVKELQNTVTETKELVVRIATKLEVAGK